VVSIWDPFNGDNMFQFFKPHGKYLPNIGEFEITAMTFDHSGRRLVTGSRDGYINMWNYSNGQKIRRLKKLSCTETTDILFLNFSSHKCIAVTGWDRKITLFGDQNDEFESKPIRIFNSSGVNASRNHTDDISCLAFCPPYFLVSGSVDGSIIVWNIETGYFISMLRENFLELRCKEEKPVEKVQSFCFLN
jgi:WD40 repeat protein